MKSFKWLLNQVRFSWISLISKVKSFFQTNDTHYQTTASNGNDHTRKISVENTIEAKVNEEDVWYDSLKEQEPGEKERDLDEEEFFDAIENLDEEEVSANIEGKEYEKNKYYSLQDGLQEKNEFDHTTHTLTLAFEIEKPFPDSDLSKFKLCELKQNGDKYTFILENDQKNRIELHSEYLNIYFPKYFEKHRKKGAYTELFSQEENRISNDIIIPLQVPKEASILTKECNWLIRKVVGEIPYYPVGKSLEYCRSRVNFFLNLNNIMSFSLKSAKAQYAAMLSGTPTETNWPIKDILVRGSFINQHIPRVEEAYIDKHYIVEETFEVVNVECASELKISQPSI
ncbi:hypothetical protein OUY_01115 [Wolbachia endosymbiont of Leptopilina clavipes]|uniref:hypothetical protein n=1 Tax=Wolbachia endosymbiont of Leptopilina clavipes TaxID=260213 RepID=UPI001118FBAA|nr:hypothetical protein [Wolbachia endosymbiont of Leptopilina clavipes]TNK94521.1 hypothetical protein OUY_01115 [Wolbachia endosymbiont of Leptopilina clavipes]